MNKFENNFMRVCERFNLNPSNWLPHIKPDGIYEMGTSYENVEEFPDGGTSVPIECFSIYGVFWNICYTRRKDTDKKAGRWEGLWSFLSDVDLGIYDTTNWVPMHSVDNVLDD